MTNTSTPEWQAFTGELGHAMQYGRISPEQYFLLRNHPPESVEEARAQLDRYKLDYGPHRRRRDMRQAQRDARNRWWITIAIAAASVLVVLAALYYS